MTKAQSELTDWVSQLLVMVQVSVNISISKLVNDESLLMESISLSVSKLDLSISQSMMTETVGSCIKNRKKVLIGQNRVKLVTSDVPILRKTRIASKRKEDASIMINEATWHMSAQRRSSNLDNLAALISTDPNMIDLMPNLIPRRNLSD